MENENKSLNEISSYDFGVINLIKKGWTRMDGSILQIIIAVVLYVLITIVTQNVLSMLFPQGTSTNQNFLNNQIIGILSYPVIMPISAGIIMLAILHGRGESIEFKSIFNYYHLVGKLSLAGILIQIITLIGFFILLAPVLYLNEEYYMLLLLIMSGVEIGTTISPITIFVFLLLISPGIYFSVAYTFTIALIVDKDMEVWDTMEYSRKIVTAHWFKIFGLLLLLGFIFLLGALALGIGLIWAIPLMLMTIYGVLYPLLFDGVEA